jgi:hypothetical protein
VKFRAVCGCSAIRVLRPRVHFRSAFVLSHRYPSGEVDLKSGGELQLLGTRVYSSYILLRGVS